MYNFDDLTIFLKLLCFIIFYVSLVKLNFMAVLIFFCIAQKEKEIYKRNILIIIYTLWRPL